MKTVRRVGWKMLQITLFVHETAVTRTLQK